MTLFIKICGLRDADAVDAAVAAGANAVGFVFTKSVRRIAPADAAELAARLPSNVQRVAVMRHPTLQLWTEVLREFTPDVLQTDLSDLASLEVPATVEVWPVIREGEQIESLPTRFVFEGGQSGSGQTVDWNVAAAKARRGELILAGGLNPANIAQAIATVRPYGIDVSSGVEKAPGVKDAQKIRVFIEAARAAENRL
jgi:phosphoribosylanthranilate isomerase